MIEIKAPNKISPTIKGIKIFLAGTIDMGDSEDWQSKVVEHFKEYEDIQILNPRRDDWDSSWVQEYENPQFYQQVNWELNALEKSHLIIFNFLPDSQSPITLLELGLMADKGNVVVCCPKKFWRSGNVHVICEKYGIPLFDTMEGLLKDIDDLF